MDLLLRTRDYVMIALVRPTWLLRLDVGPWTPMCTVGRAGSGRRQDRKLQKWTVTGCLTVAAGGFSSVWPAPASARTGEYSKRARMHTLADTMRTSFAVCVCSLLERQRRMFSFSFESESVYAKQRRPNLDIANKARPLSFSPLLSSRLTPLLLCCIQSHICMLFGKDVGSYPKAQAVRKRGLWSPGWKGQI